MTDQGEQTREWTKELIESIGMWVNLLHEAGITIHVNISVEAKP